jgi:hypothetical protein
LLLREVAESGNDTVDELQLRHNLGITSQRLE